SVGAVMEGDGRAVAGAAPAVLGVAAGAVSAVVVDVLLGAPIAARRAVLLPGPVGEELAGRRRADPGRRAGAAVGPADDRRRRRAHDRQPLARDRDRRRARGLRLR